MSTQALLLLGGAGLLVALLSVLIDRLNFPQPRFRARTVVYDRKGPHRDRTGAHIVVDTPPGREGHWWQRRHGRPDQGGDGHGQGRGDHGHGHGSDQRGERGAP